MLLSHYQVLPITECLTGVARVVQRFPCLSKSKSKAPPRADRSTGARAVLSAWPILSKTATTFYFWCCYRIFKQNSNHFLCAKTHVLLLHGNGGK